MELNAESFKTYAKYAIGEILLIVVGILIAIEVNNWNEARAEASEQLRIIQNLAQVIREDELILGSVIQNFSRTIGIVNEIEQTSTSGKIHPNASSDWVRVVFWSSATSAVFSNYSNSSIVFNDLELSTALSNYISRVASIESTKSNFLLPAVQEIRQLMDGFIIREYNEGTEQIEPLVDASRLVNEYLTNIELQEALYRLYLLSRSSVSDFEFLEVVRSELETLANNKIEELSDG